MNIGLDLDDTLLDFVPDMVGFYNEINKADYKKHHFSSYDLAETWGGTVEQTQDFIERFYESDEFTNLKPVSGAVEFVSLAKEKGHKIWVITSRPEFVEKVTIKNIENVFGSIFEDVIFLGHHYGLHKKETKGEVCDKLEIDLFADDHLKHCTDANNSKRQVYLMNNPWNIEREISAGIKRINFLSEIDI